MLGIHDRSIILSDEERRDNTRTFDSVGKRPECSAREFTETPLDAAAAEAALSAVDHMLAAHEPFPGVAVDGDWNVVRANGAALALVDGLPGHLVTPSINIYRVSLHPEGLAGRSRNRHEWAPMLVEQLRRSASLTARPSLVELLDEVLGYPGVGDLPVAATAPNVLIPFVVDAGDGTELSLFTTITTFGTPHDVTVGELAIELFFPADHETERTLRRTR